MWMRKGVPIQLIWPRIRTVNHVMVFEAVEFIDSLERRVILPPPHLNHQFQTRLDKSRYFDRHFLQEIAVFMPNHHLELIWNSSGTHHRREDPQCLTRQTRT
jgi:hypothetical protein